MGRGFDLDKTLKCVAASAKVDAAQQIFRLQRRSAQTEQQDRKDENRAHFPVPSNKAGKRCRLGAAQGGDERFPLDACR